MTSGASWPNGQSSYISQENDGITKVVRLRMYRGKIIQDCDVYIGREINYGGWNLSRSKWANPFKIEDYGDRETVIQLYKKYLMSKPELMNCLPELKGKRLGCWCKPESCHGDVLAEISNELK